MTDNNSIFTRGIKQMLFAIFCFGLVNVMVKGLNNIPPMEIVWFRGVFMFLFSFVFIKHQKASLWGNNKKILLLRGIFGTLGVSLFFITLQRMELATAQVIHYIAPIFTTIIALFFLKEKVKPLQWLFFLISFLGVVVVKGFGNMDAIDFTIGIVSAFFSGCAYTCIRKLRGTENPHVVIFYFALVALPAMSIYFSLFPENWVVPINQQWFMLLGIGVFTQIAQYFMTKAYQGEVASRVAGASYIGIVFAILFGMVFFSEIPTIYTLLGISLVLFGVLLNLNFSKKTNSKKML